MFWPWTSGIEELPVDVPAKDATTGSPGPFGRTNGEMRIAYSIAYELLTARNAKLEIIQLFHVGGGGRTRTYEAMKRLIYSQLSQRLGPCP